MRAASVPAIGDTRARHIGRTFLRLVGVRKWGPSALSRVARAGGRSKERSRSEEEATIAREVGGSVIGCHLDVSDASSIAA